MRTEKRIGPIKWKKKIEQCRSWRLQPWKCRSRRLRCYWNTIFDICNSSSTNESTFYEDSEYNNCSNTNSETRPDLNNFNETSDLKKFVLKNVPHFQVDDLLKMLEPRLLPMLSKYYFYILWFRCLRSGTQNRLRIQNRFNV